MKTFIFSFKNSLIIIICTSFLNITNAQSDSTSKFGISNDTSKLITNIDAPYSRPFLETGKLPIAIGGYMEANSQYLQTDGVFDGFSFQFRRLTIFLSSTISKNIKFLSEIEFEDGTKEINIEFAALDLEFHPLLNLRGGIIMNPNELGMLAGVGVSCLVFDLYRKENKTATIIKILLIFWAR